MVKGIVQKSRASALVLSILNLSTWCSQSPALAQSFTVGDAQPFITFQQMKNNEIYWPDGALGFVSKGHGQYFVFGAGASTNGIGPGITVVPQGTYKFAGTLDQFVPANVSGGNPVPSMESGRLQPAPNGEQFDRDYAGGGPTYQYSIDGHAKLVQVYHGEYHTNYPAGLPFYGGSGLSISDPNGNHFAKIGEFLSPHFTLAQFEASGQTGLPVDGNLIEADNQGRFAHFESGSARTFVYDIFTDRNVAAGPQGFAIARVSKNEFLESLAMNKAPLFGKYYAPDGGFEQPGLGGSSTFIVTQGTDSLAWPMVAYNDYLGKFMLFYQTNQKMIQVRVSDNLMSWSAPTTLFTSNSSTVKTFYPTVVGTGPHPNVLGKTFYLFFQQRNASGPLNPNYYRCEVTVTR